MNDKNMKGGISARRTRSQAHLGVSMGSIILMMMMIIGSSSQMVAGKSIENDRPLIGIYTQDTSKNWNNIPNKEEEYIAASYVKLVESAGARPVAVSYNLDHDKLLATLDELDGFLFPGGGADLSLNGTFGSNGKVILDYAVKKGNFPVVGICLGFQLLSIIASNNSDLLSHFESENMVDHPKWTSEFKQSKMYQFFPSNVEDISFFENHHWGVTPESFDKELSSFFNLLATSTDKEKAEYVSVVEAKDFPIFGFQFHPEKNAYEWDSAESIPHGYIDLEAPMSVAKIIGYYARKHQRPARDPSETTKMLIYNSNPVFAQASDPTFSYEQVYFFPKGYTIPTIERRLI